MPKQIQRIRQTSLESNSSDHGPRGQRTASVRLISSTSSHLSDLPEDLVVGNDDVIDEAETDGFEGTIQIKSLIYLLCSCSHYRSAIIKSYRSIFILGVDCGCCRFGGKKYCTFHTYFQANKL